MSSSSRSTEVLQDVGLEPGTWKPGFQPQQSDSFLGKALAGVCTEIFPGIRREIWRSEQDSTHDAIHPIQPRVCRRIFCSKKQARMKGDYVSSKTRLRFFFFKEEVHIS